MWENNPPSVPGGPGTNLSESCRQGRHFSFQLRFKMATGGVDPLGSSAAYTNFRSSVPQRKVGCIRMHLKFDLVNCICL